MKTEYRQTQHSQPGGEGRDGVAYLSTTLFDRRFPMSRSRKENNLRRMKAIKADKRKAYERKAYLRSLEIRNRRMRETGMPADVLAMADALGIPLSNPTGHAPARSAAEGR